MTRKLRIGVIFGGRSGEHEVSLVSASSVMKALDREKYHIVPIGITPEGRWIGSEDSLRLLKEKAPLQGIPDAFLVPEPGQKEPISASAPAHVNNGIDIIFPLVHGTYGEDGSLQGLLELADIPYVGAGVIGSALGMDKILQKELFRQAGLPVPKYRWYLSARCLGRMKSVVQETEESLKYPLFVKPANTGSSVGISKAHNRDELIGAIRAAAEYDRKIIIEQGVMNAREIEVSVLGNDDPEASLAGEVIPSNEFYDYDAKYVDGKSEVIIPADLPKKITKDLKKLAICAFRALDCCGMARVDFFLTKNKHRIFLNEINTIPGFTSISMYPKLWEASGLRYPDLLDRLIELAIERHREKMGLTRKYAAKSNWYRGHD